jgi:hypothetical protein
MTLYNLAESLILEVASRDTIMGCMGDKRIAEVYYDDNEDPGGKGKRWVEIYCYGKSKAGNDIIRVYQVGGDTKTIHEPKPLFNPNGDKDMIQIYNILKFE